MDTSQNVTEAVINPCLVNMWDLVKAELAQSLSPNEFNVWIKPLQALSQDQTLNLEVPNEFFLNWVHEHYEPAIRSIFSRECEKAGLNELNLTLVLPLDSIITSEQSDLSETIVAPMTVHRTVYPNEGPLRINPDFTFSNFVAGNPNRLAYEASRAFARGENLGTDILFINADHGLGKTHLIQALAQKCLTLHPDMHLFYLSAEDYTSEMVSSIKNQKMEDFKLKYRKDCDILLVEEMGFLAGKPKIQEEFNYTLELLLNHGKKVVMTSSKELKFLSKGLSEQLKSKMNSALLARINPPDYETRLAILTHKTQKSGLKLDLPILELIADRLQNDIRLLEGCLMTLSAKSRFLNQPVSLDMAKECLSFVQDTAEDDLSAEKIIKLVCQNYHIGETEIGSVSRKRQFNEARSMGMYLIRNLTNKTLEEIGACFHRSHSTTLYTINQVEMRLKKDQKMKDLVSYLTNQLVQK
jgi:chromosomal replication initiator protein